MNNLTDWPGKADDISISYEAGLLKNQQRLLAVAGTTEFSFPVISYPQTENPRDIVDVAWENTVRKADRTDYLTAVACGSVAGLIDIFYLGEFSLEKVNSWGYDKINKFVKKASEINGFQGDDLSDAIAFMEKRYKMASDSKTAEFGGGLQHHLRDFSHHFSLGGLICSLFTQFTGKVIGTDSEGAILLEELSDKTFIGKNFEEKILFGTINWFFHMVSDMAGSGSAPGKGTGIPGPFLSLMKELSALPCIRDKKIGGREFYTWVSGLFNGTLLAKRDVGGKITEPVRFNLRTEIGILHEAGRQFIPVIINECLVRGTYFMRRFYIAVKNAEIHSVSDLENIDPSELLPFNNRIIRRMITVACGTFTAIDVVDAGVRAIMKNRGFHPRTLVDFAVRINIAGVGHFLVACKTDGHFISEDIREEKARRDQAGKEYEKTIADLNCLSLNYEQMRILYSLEKLIIDDDIAVTADESVKKEKLKWQSAWREKLLSAEPLPTDAEDEFFKSERELSSYFNDIDDGSWQYLIVMGAGIFRPYYPVYGNNADNSLKKLKFKSNYLEKKFTGIQRRISKEDVNNLRKACRKASLEITGSKKNMTIGMIGTGAAIAATGGAAFAFAPVIATALAGGSAVTGLSGAALTSYSLAAIGGGSLAAGGLGMVGGGTAVITGGGALLGMIGGTGVSAAATMKLLSENGYVLNECCRLLAFSRAVLYNRYKDYKSIENIYRSVSEKIERVNRDLAVFSETGADTDPEEKKKRRMLMKAAEKSLKFLKNCEKKLAGMLKYTET